MQLTKEQLQAQLYAIVEKEQKELFEKHYPKFKKLEGKFFKRRNNFSAPKKPSDYWYVFEKVTSVTPDDLYMSGSTVFCRCKSWSFQTDSEGAVYIRHNDGYTHSLGKEISEAEFNQAWNNMIEQLDKLP